MDLRDEQRYMCSTCQLVICHLCCKQAYLWKEFEQTANMQDHHVMSGAVSVQKQTLKPLQEYLGAGPEQDLPLFSGSSWFLRSLMCVIKSLKRCCGAVQQGCKAQGISFFCHVSDKVSANMLSTTSGPICAAKPVATSSRTVLHTESVKIFHDRAVRTCT